jgi:hypothetical protein
MTSIILPARNAPQWTGRALASIRYSIEQLGWKDVEMILLDDNSDALLGIIPLFQEFIRQSKFPCKIVRFKKHQHYSRIFSAGLSIARGDKVFFLSNDMIFTPDFFRLLMEVSESDQSIGMVRGTSNHADSHPNYSVAPPKAQMTFREILGFSRTRAEAHRQEFSFDSALSGDAILINRSLIDAIGVVDPAYPSYFGDVDYGLRALRAGFKLACAKGAWLFHEGAGHIKHQTQPDAGRERLVQEAYDVFRAKWGCGLPERYDPGQTIDFPKCRVLLPMELHRYVSPVMLTGEVADDFSI